MDKKTINILLCIDDFKGDYTRHCAVTILSLLETNKKHKIKIFIMSSCLPQENIDELKRIVDSYNQEIEFIIHDDIIPEDIKESVINRRNLTWGTRYRLFFPLYIKGVDRVLYLDCDVIVTKDISKIYNMDMKGKSIAGCTDAPIREYLKKQTFSINKYINAGVILIDVKKYNLAKINKKNINKLNEVFGERINDADQDYLNLIFNDDILVYNNTMNYLVLNKYFNKGFKKAAILHCLQKPYKKQDNCPNFIVNLYFSYLKRTKWGRYEIEGIKNIPQDIYLFLTYFIGTCFGKKAQVLFQITISKFKVFIVNIIKKLSI